MVNGKTRWKRTFYKHLNTINSLLHDFLYLFKKKLAGRKRNKINVKNNKKNIFHFFIQKWAKLVIGSYMAQYAVKNFFCEKN